VTLIEFPAIGGGFQENNFRADNQMPLYSFMLVEEKAFHFSKLPATHEM
jgi:hypothetical protein